MINKVLFALIIFLILLSSIDIIIQQEERLTLGLTIAEVLAAIMMLINGTYMDRKYFKMNYAFLLAMLMGMLFKIMHLTGADLINIAALLGVMAVYVVHFFQKSRQRLLDYMKLILVVFYVASGIMFIFHVMPSEWQDVANDATHGLVWLTFVVFIVIGWRRKTLFTPKESAS